MSRNNKETKENFFSDKHREVFKAIFLLALAILFFLSLFSLAGLAGGYLAFGLKLIFGKVAFVFPFFFLLGSLLFFSKEVGPRARTRILLGFFLVLLTVSSFWYLFTKNDPSKMKKIEESSGYLGFGVSYSLEKVFAFWGAIVILLALFVFSIFLAFEEPLKGKIGFFISFFKKIFVGFILFFRNILKSIFTKKEKPVQFNKKEIQQEDYDEAEREGLLKTKDKKESKGILPLGFKRKTHQKIELPLDLLSYHEEKAEARNIDEGKYIIKKTLENFGIPVEMAEVKVGPTITQYSLRPKEGVKLSRITALSNDLALALAAHPIRIEAPIPGKSLVGIEVPNKKIAIVSLREIMDSDSFKNRTSSLTIPIGKDVAGNVWLADIKKMPHLLISGATNSGKTVMIHSIITSLLYENSPDDLRFILVDPKRVELVLYNGMPHLLTPVITGIKETINALHWTISEMERRFDIFAANSARDIESHNKTSEEKLPYIILVIDELADLMVAAGQDVETSIIRLAQMARATGIHLILATQRPSVDIITGLIKANFTSRIAFSVVSMTDSRTILDFSGAEKLLGRGDMLFISSQISKPKRLQAPFVADDDSKKIVDFLKNKEVVEYLPEVVQDRVVGEGRTEEFSLEEDGLLPEARDVVIKMDRASATLLQRYLRIGYARAARLLDLLEQEGTIGPPDGARPREVLKKSGDVVDVETETDDEKNSEETENDSDNDL